MWTQSSAGEENYYELFSADAFRVPRLVDGAILVRSGSGRQNLLEAPRRTDLRVNLLERFFRIRESRAPRAVAVGWEIF